MGEEGNERSVSGEREQREVTNPECLVLRRQKASDDRVCSTLVQPAEDPRVAQVVVPFGNPRKEIREKSQISLLRTTQLELDGVQCREQIARVLAGGHFQSSLLDALAPATH